MTCDAPLLEVSMWTRRRFLKTLSTVPVAGAVYSIGLPVLEPTSPVSADDSVHFSDGGSTSFGGWWADVRFSPGSWSPGAKLDVEVYLHLSPAMVQALSD